MNSLTDLEYQLKLEMMWKDNARYNEEKFHDEIFKALELSTKSFIEEQNKKINDFDLVYAPSAPSEDEKIATDSGIKDVNKCSIRAFYNACKKENIMLIREFCVLTTFEEVMFVIYDELQKHYNEIKSILYSNFVLHSDDLNVMLSNFDILEEILHQFKNNEQINIDIFEYISQFFKLRITVDCNSKKLIYGEEYPDGVKINRTSHGGDNGHFYA